MSTKTVRSRHLRVGPGRLWTKRLEAWIEQGKGNSAFRSANAKKLAACLNDQRDGARMVVNLGAASLLRFLRDDRFRNFYDLRKQGLIPEMGSGGTDSDSAVREAVDRLMGFIPDGSNIYFGAVAMESAGVRFYGEWSLALAGQVDDTQLVDRDSYEFMFEPLCSRSDRNALAVDLRGTWAADLSAMAALKIRDALAESDRLVTEGRMRQLLLCGEEFIEVHRRGHFTPAEVSEVRQAAVDVASAEQICTAYEQGAVPTLEQIIWVSGRAEVTRALARRSLRTRVVEAENVR